MEWILKLMPNPIIEATKHCCGFKLINEIINQKHSIGIKYVSSFEQKLIIHDKIAQANEAEI